MQNKVSLVGIKARDAVIKGMDYVVDAVESTMGPFGLNCLIEKGNTVTNDGYRISKEIVGSIENEFERRGGVTIHEASSKTNDKVGDATSSSECLARAIVKEAVKLLPNEKTFSSKKTPAEVIRMIETEKNEVIEKLSKMATPILSEAELISSAKVSVEDDELANLIGKAQWALGPDGILIAEETAEANCSVQNIKGIRIDNGFGTSVMINNQEKQTLELEDVNIILTNYTLSDLGPLRSVLDQLVKAKKTKIVIIARAFSPDCIKLCLENHKAGVFLYPMNAPYTNQAEVMRDLAVVTGGRYIDTEEAELEDMNASDVGFATKIIARRYDAIIAGKDNNEEKIKARVSQIEDQLKGEVSEFEKKNLQARISQLANGFGVVKVGATSETERKYKKDKCDDVVNAVRLALQGGVVAGAGLAFKEIADTMPDGSILKKPLQRINQVIMTSAPADFVVESWVRDPFLVLKAALENACSVAGTFATTNISICTQNAPKCNCNKKQNEEE